MTVVIDIARDYLARGWQPVVIPAGCKRPTSKRWQSRQWEPEHFGAHDNIGVILGRRSGDLVDIDLDCVEAIDIADLYLPSTGAIFGRQSRLRSHRLFIATSARKEAFADPLDGSCLLELRADGRDGAAHQSLFPPSIVDGEQRAWDDEGIQPAIISAARLRQRCAWLAIG